MYIVKIAKLDHEPIEAYRALVALSQQRPESRNLYKLHQDIKESYQTVYHWSIAFDWLDRLAEYDSDTAKQRVEARSDSEFTLGAEALSYDTESQMRATRALPRLIETLVDIAEDDDCSASARVAAIKLAFDISGYGQTIQRPSGDSRRGAMARVAADLRAAGVPPADVRAFLARYDAPDGAEGAEL